MSVHHHQHVETPLGRGDRTVSTSRFSPGQLIGGIVGVIMGVVGIFTVINAGIDSTMNEPLANSFGLHQSAAVGLAEIVLGLLILVTAASIAYRGAMGFFGALSLIGGVVIVAATSQILKTVGSDRSTGWFAIILGAVVIAASLLPSFVHSTDRIEEV